MGKWDAWIGRSEFKEDCISEGLASRWLATFDRAAPLGGVVPQGLHWCLALPNASTAMLGADGHPRRDGGPGSFLPPVPLPRRMWAGSSVDFVHPLQVGGTIARHSTIRSVTEKIGASGHLVFVDIAHETHCDGVCAISEVQTIVYRDAAPLDAPLAPPPGSDAAFDPAPWREQRTIIPSEALLFRYSALTFNSHRIHYDLPYARDAERYRGLVVHGPLTASLLLDLVRRQLGDNKLAEFSFRGLSPAICGEPLHLVMRQAETIELAAFAGDGRPVMQASGRLRSA